MRRIPLPFYHSLAFVVKKLRWASEEPYINFLAHKHEETLNEHFLSQNFNEIFISYDLDLKIYPISPSILKVESLTDKKFITHITRELVGQGDLLIFDFISTFELDFDKVLSKK